MEARNGTPEPALANADDQRLVTDQPRVSALFHGRLEGFSSDRLFRFLNALDQEIEIVIRQTKKKRAKR